MSKSCPKCGAVISDTAKFCGKCGCNVKEYEQKTVDAFCTECGAKRSLGDTFCPECGARYENGEDNTAKDIEIGVADDFHLVHADQLRIAGGQVEFLVDDTFSGGGDNCELAEGDFTVTAVKLCHEKNFMANSMGQAFT